MKSFAKKLTLGAAAVLAISAAGSAYQAHAATGDVTIDAVIVDAITVTPQTPLNFANVAASAALGNVDVDAAGARTFGGGASGAGGTAAQGTFDVSATGGLVVTISTPATATINSGGDSMTVDSFILDDGTVSNTGTAILGATINSTMPAGAGVQTQNLSLGGTLRVAATQAPGTYTGTVTITADYM